MARQARKALIQRNAAQVASLPAPVGGWNARDSLANMNPLDAVQMTNMFPGTSNVRLRGGSSVWATGMSGQVESLMTYNGAATTKMFAADATGKKIYDVTAAGAVGAAAVSGLTNARFEYVNIANAAGNYLIICNGADSVRSFDGAAWATPVITGVTSADLNNVELFKNRLWFIEKNSLKAWYLATQAIAGAASLFDLRSVARQGGYLVDICTWTVDAGYGVDDNLAFITSNGEVILYRGTDPASAATFALIGVWQLGNPVGNRCMAKYGGDLLILTDDGVVPMSKALQSSRVDPRTALSDKIQGAINTATTLYGDNFGWDFCFHSEANALILNVPITTGTQQQYVMNTITECWCNFTGWNANCWAITGSTPYFGADGTVYQAWTNTYGDAGNDIATYTLQAFNYLEQRGVEKYFTRARPNIFSDGTPAIFIGLNVDYQVANITTPLTFSPTPYGVWDTSLWDTALWGADLTITNNWQGVTGIGYCCGVVFKSASSGLQIEWAATDVVFQGGWAGI